MRTRNALYVVLVAAVSLTGFGPCTGGNSDPIDLPRPPPPPPPPGACTSLEEAACITRQDCEPIYAGTCACPAICLPDGMGGCQPCECADDAVEFVGCQALDTCSGLSEAQCSQNPECEARYSSSCDGGEAPSKDLACPAPDCGAPIPPPPCDGGVTYDGCYPRGDQCPAVCDIYCPFGNVLDRNGCATCSCNPPPSGCDGLDEQQCLATPGCNPIYGGQGCVCPDCGPGMECPPCDCAGDSAGLRAPEPYPNEYQGCYASDPCAGLPEYQCSSTPGCTPVYDGGGACECAPCAPGSSCEPCACSGGSGGGEDSDGNAGGARRAPPPDDYPQNGYAGCVSSWDRCENLDEQTCNATPGCVGEYATCGGGSGGAAPCPPDDPSCGGDGFRPCDPYFLRCYADHQPPPPPHGECMSDSDCPNGYCEHYATCAALGCPPPPPSQCVYPSCDDNSQAICDVVPPRCGPGEVSAVRNGCFACVDARTCGTPPPTEYCFSDADCPNGYCEYGRSAPAGDPEEAGLRAPPPGMCVHPSCGDGSELACRMLEPDCGPGRIAAIINSCYECVDARSCM